jgi:hypothetical protein
MTSPFYYGTVDDLANVQDRGINNKIYNGVINWSWGDENNENGDYVQGNLNPPNGKKFVLARKSSRMVKLATGFLKVGNIISEENTKRGVIGESVKGLGSVTVYKLLCDDTDYIGIGLVFGRPQTPSKEQYYCVHKDYVRTGKIRIPANRSCAINSRNPDDGNNVLRQLGWDSPLAYATEDTHLITNSINEGIELLEKTEEPVVTTAPTSTTPTSTTAGTIKAAIAINNNDNDEESDYTALYIVILILFAVLGFVVYKRNKARQMQYLQQQYQQQQMEYQQQQMEYPQQPVPFQPMQQATYYQ